MRSLVAEAAAAARTLLWSSCKCLLRAALLCTLARLVQRSQLAEKGIIAEIDYYYCSVFYYYLYYY